MPKGVISCRFFHYHSRFFFKLLLSLLPHHNTFFFWHLCNKARDMSRANLFVEKNKRKGVTLARERHFMFKLFGVLYQLVEGRKDASAFFFLFFLLFTCM
jgi:hypothetical protein